MARASHLSRIALWLGTSKQAADDKKFCLTNYWHLGLWPFTGTGGSRAPPVPYYSLAGKSKQAADEKKSWLTSYWQLAQGHPADVTVNVVRMIVDLGQSATRLDVSSGAAPLHYAASVRHLDRCALFVS